MNSTSVDNRAASRNAVIGHAPVLEPSRRQGARTSSGISRPARAR